MLAFFHICRARVASADLRSSTASVTSMTLVGDGGCKTWASTSFLIFSDSLKSVLRCRGLPW